MKTNKIFVLGFDGGEPSLVNPWIDSGELPNLRTIRDTGVSTTLESTIPSITAPAMVSFMTGCDPSNTGITSFLRSDGCLVNYSDIDLPTIWEQLGSIGIKCCVAGFRLTFPPPKINGVVVAGGFLRSRDENCVNPKSLTPQVKGFCLSKRYPRLWKTLKTDSVKDPDKFTDEFIELTRRQFEIFQTLADENQCDAGFFWLENSDALQHFCWHTPHNLKRFYQFVDKLIGEYKTKHPDTNIIIMSDHGFAENPECTFHPNHWLETLGYFKPVKGCRSWRQHVKHHCLNFMRLALSPYYTRMIREFVRQGQPSKPPHRRSLSIALWHLSRFRPRYSQLSNHQTHANNRHRLDCAGLFRLQKSHPTRWHGAHGNLFTDLIGANP